MFDKAKLKQSYFLNKKQQKWEKHADWLNALIKKSNKQQ